MNPGGYSGYCTDWWWVSYHCDYYIDVLPAKDKEYLGQSRVAKSDRQPRLVMCRDGAKLYWLLLNAATELRCALSAVVKRDVGDRSGVRGALVCALRRSLLSTPSRGLVRPRNVSLRIRKPRWVRRRGREYGC